MSEIMTKASIGKLTIDFDAVAIAEKSGFEMLDYSASDALPLKGLPFHHRDLFDRMLISQSLSRSYCRSRKFTYMRIKVLIYCNFMRI